MLDNQHPDESRRMLLLTNLKSRNGDTDISVGLQRLREANIEVVHNNIDNPESINKIIKQHQDSISAVLLAGGDGTMNCAAEALLQTGLTLGILPMGTANDLARTLELPEALQDACDVIINGHTSQVDLGCVNDVYFFNAASIGLGVDVTRRLTSELKKRWGVLGYARSLIDTLRACRSFTAEVTYDDGQAQQLRSIQITVGNGKFYGGGMMVADDAAIDNQRLDLYSLQPQNFFRLLTLAPALRFGPQGKRETIDTLHASKIKIVTKTRRSVSTDGELLTHTPATFQVHPQAVNVFTPEPGTQSITQRFIDHVTPES